MTRYISKRLLLLVVVVIGVLTGTFILIHMSPGDPALNFLGQKATPAALDALRHKWGLDQPLPIQYLVFLGDVVRGNLGDSIVFGAPVLSLIVVKLPPTLLLMLMALIFAIVISLPLATWVAVRGRGAADTSVRVFNAVFQGTPSFFLGTMLILYFGLKLQWFPVGGYGSTFDEHVYSLVLPALTVAFGIVPLLVNSLRASLTDSLQSEYIAFARAKGLRASTVLGAYAIRNGSISGISIVAIQAGNLVGGAIVVENIFAIPGMGSMMMTGIIGRDFPVVQSTTIVFAFIVVLVFLITDLVYGVLDPRARVV